MSATCTIGDLRSALLLAATQATSRREVCICILAVTAVVFLALVLTWTATRRRLGTELWAHGINVTPGDAPPIRMTLLHEEPCIRILEGFVTSAEAEHLVTTYRTQLTRSTVSASTGAGGLTETSQARTSSTVFLPEGNADDVVHDIEIRAMLLTGIPIKFWETFQLTHYTQGQEYKPHFDWFDASENNRTLTLFVYLNDVAPEQGGATEFTKLGIKVQPQLGRALLWYNCSAKGAAVVCDADTEHAGTPPLSCEKYALNCWARTKHIR